MKKGRFFIIMLLSFAIFYISLLEEVSGSHYVFSERYRGFFIEITPTNSTLINVLTGNITPHPHCVGRCSPMEDEATFYEYLYYVNKSGSFLVDSYLFISSLYTNTTPSKIGIAAETIRGRITGGYLMFSEGNRTYKIPLSRIKPYLWEVNMNEYIVGYFVHGGVIFFPEVKISAYEASVNYSIENYTEYGEGIEVRVGGIYNLTFYKKSFNEYGIPSWKSFRTVTISWYKLKQLVKKPLYVFFYDGRKLKAFPVMRVRMDVVAKRVSSNGIKVLTTYTFRNIAEKLRQAKTPETSNSPTSGFTSSSISSASSVPSPKTCGVGMLIILSLFPLMLKRKRP